MGNSNNNTRRVVVTGMGTVCPIGHSVLETWRRSLEGQPGIKGITHYDSTECPVKIAGEVKDFDPTKPVGPFQPGSGREIAQAVSQKDLKKMGRFVHLGLFAAMEAYADSGLDAHRNKIAPERIGTNIGAGIGGLPEIEQTALTLAEKGYRRVSPFFIPSVIANMASGQLSILLNLKGPNLCNVTACSSSAHSMGEAFYQIQRGDADIMFAGGTEAVISPLAVGGFAAMKALSTRNDSPEKASRPFDKDRDGFVIGEGAAVLVLEEYEHAKARGAKIHAEILGYGLSGDAHHMTSPAPEGEGGYRAMKMALDRSGLKAEQIGYINAHGTSTPAGDVLEAVAISRLFPNAKSHLHVSSTKSMTGHLLGAAGALESIFSIMAINDGRIPPTINLDSLDPECEKLGIDFTANVSVKKEIQYSLSNSFGFGGTNATLIFGKI